MKPEVASARVTLFVNGVVYAVLRCSASRRNESWAARFEAAIAQANGTDSIAVRAVRAYLDVCFFHPFADGNARAARLALDHVLTRAGLGLHAVDPLFVIARSTDDVSGVYTMTEMLRLLAGPLA